MPEVGVIERADRIFADTEMRLWRKPRPLWAYLVLFAASVALPLLALSIYFLEQASELEQARVERQVLQTSQMLAFDVDREIDRAITVLETLATSGALARGDLVAFHAQGRRATQRTTAAVLLIDPSMQQLVNTRVDFGTALPPTSDPDTARRALQTNEPQVSNLFHGVVSKRPVINVAVPVTIDRERRYILIMTFEANHFAEILQAQALDPDWITAISDRSGVVLARSARHQDFVGTSLPAGLFQRSLSERGAFRTTSITGTPIIRATSISQRAGWLVSATAPAAVVDAPRNQAWLIYLALASSALLIGGALAFIFARFMAQPLSRAAQAAVLLGRGQLIEHASSPLAEANALTNALSRASYERKAAEASNALLAAIVSSTGDAILSMDVSGTIQTWNPAAERIFGFAAQEAVGQSAGIVVPDDRAEERAAIYAEIRAGRTVAMETVRRTKSGQNLDVSINVAPLRSKDGSVIGICSVVHDISELKRREEHAQLLVRELAHRTKNLLAVISGMARETARHSSDLEQFGIRFSSRIQGLARSQDLLLQREWSGAFLHDLLAAQLQPFIQPGGERLELNGPEVFLKPEAVHNVGLAIHELATNASKHGALSVLDGRVIIDWRLESGPEQSVALQLMWREVGGPTVHPPAAKGFGHVVVETMVTRSLQAKVFLDYRTEGFVWRASIPSRFFVATSPAGADQTDNLSHAR